MALDFSSFQLIRLTSEYEIKPFDCGDDDLNGFLFDDAKKYLTSLLAVTYLLESDQETVAFFSLSNDKIAVEDVGSNNRFKKYFQKIMPPGKHLRSYPSVKIGRLGVSNNYQNQGLGGDLLTYVKLFFLDNNKTGCKYITVDAYEQSISFYQKNGFDFLQNKQGGHTRLMYFDLEEIASIMSD